MPRADCTGCGKTYSYPGNRGSRLSDHPCPTCGSAGKAHRAAVTKMNIQTCPECKKAGLQLRKAYINDKHLGHPEYATGKMYCPRCDLWVTPIRTSKEVVNDSE